MESSVYRRQRGILRWFWFRDAAAVGDEEEDEGAFRCSYSWWVVFLVQFLFLSNRRLGRLFAMVLCT